VSPAVDFCYRFEFCRIAAFLSLENITRCGMIVNDFLPQRGKKCKILNLNN
jgi:hypothetical protein